MQGPGAEKRKGFLALLERKQGRGAILNEIQGARLWSCGRLSDDNLDFILL